MLFACVTWHVLHVTCQVSHVTCHMSHLTPKPQELGSWNFERKFTSSHLSPATCHMSCVTCHVSRVTSNMSKLFCIYLFIYLFTYWWIHWVEGLLLIGLTPSSFQKDHNIATGSKCRPNSVNVIPDSKCAEFSVSVSLPQLSVIYFSRS